MAFVILVYAIALVELIIGIVLTAKKKKGDKVISEKDKEFLEYARSVYPKSKG